ncbi:MAG: hypothetical protein B1H08_01800 [Candidatus Omnitrophica bacterium 4484_171]|nr:MAG: hypothetical protein B1H08_01800 [Candidatus Omnitrophica bacterium 4484_171]
MKITETHSSTDLKNFLRLIDYRVAQTREELEKAYHLVYKEYLKRGYTNETSSKIRVSIYNIIPQTTTFIAIVENEVIATATLIEDSPLGLPMDKIYRNELAQFRNNNKKLCEISMLASDTDLFKAGTSIMSNSKKMFFIFYLFKLIFDYADNFLALDFICITIHPKHKLVYDFLSFKDLGNLKVYSQVNGAPAIAMYCDLRSAKGKQEKQKREDLYKMFYRERTPDDKFMHKFVLTPADLRYFFAEKTDILRTIDPKDLEYIKTCYPNYDFSKIII